MPKRQLSVHDQHLQYRKNYRATFSFYVRSESRRHRDYCALVETLRACFLRQLKSCSVNVHSSDVKRNPGEKEKQPSREAHVPGECRQQTLEPAKRWRHFFFPSFCGVSRCAADDYRHLVLTEHVFRVKGKKKRSIKNNTKARSVLRRPRAREIHFGGFATTHLMRSFVSTLSKWLGSNLIVACTRICGQASYTSLL